jgi:hypothetical protein
VTAEMSLEVYEAYISGFHDALRSRLKGRPSLPTVRGSDKKQ